MRRHGDGTYTQRLVPVSVTGLTGLVDLSAGLYQGCALLADGTGRCWGYNVYGELGTGSTTSSNVPASVVGLTGASQIVSGHLSSCARLVDGTARCWGKNDYGKLGDGTIVARAAPVVVSAAAATPLTGVARIARGPGALASCASMSDGKARCWGDNSTGQFGNGTTTGNPFAASAITP